MQISIHALREEGDAGSRPRRSHQGLFLSTPSARRATYSPSLAGAVMPCISIHALREEGDLIAAGLKAVFLGISIHALREEGDSGCNAGHNLSDVFLSTPSARRATSRSELVYSIMGISIHALREEGDGSQSVVTLALKSFLSTPSARRATAHLCSQWLHPVYFYPRPPRGGRPAKEHTIQQQLIFLSTPSARRATNCQTHDKAVFRISIHALREEGDQCSHRSRFGTKKFLSTPSARRATSNTKRTTPPTPISIHALREEGDSKNRDKISIFL